MSKYQKMLEVVTDELTLAGTPNPKEAAKEVIAAIAHVSPTPLWAKVVAMAFVVPVLGAALGAVVWLCAVIWSAVLR